MYGSFDDKLNFNIVYPRIEIIQSHAAKHFKVKRHRENKGSGDIKLYLFVVIGELKVFIFGANSEGSN